MGLISLTYSNFDSILRYSWYFSFPWGHHLRWGFVSFLTALPAYQCSKPLCTVWWTLVILCSMIRFKGMFHLGIFVFHTIYTTLNSLIFSCLWCIRYLDGTLWIFLRLCTNSNIGKSYLDSFPEEGTCHLPSVDNACIQTCKGMQTASLKVYVIVWSLFWKGRSWAAIVYEAISILGAEI